MRYYIKLIIFVLFATFALSISAQTPLFSTETPETWPNEVPVNKKRVNRFTPQKYQPASFGTGRTYNTFTIENSAQTQPTTTLQNNNGSSYYRSYGTNKNENQTVIYNRPIEVSQISTSTTEQMPFADLSSNGMTRVSREDLPDDPAVTPLGDGIWEMVVMAMVWIIIKRRKLKIKNERCISES